MVPVLVADDEPSELRAVVGCLERGGIPTVASRSGREALAVAAAARPRVAVIDLHMTDLHGFEVCRRLRRGEATRDTKVLFLTGKPQDEAVYQSVLAAGGADCLWKPFDPDALTAKTRALLEGGSPRAATRLVGALPPVHALLVEADGAARRWWTGELERKGFVVAHAGGAEEALALCRRDAPDALLTNLTVSAGEDGLSLVRALRSAEEPRLRSLPVAVLSSPDSTEARLAALGAGADDFVASDSDPAALAALVRARLTRVYRACGPRGVRRGPCFLDLSARVFYDGQGSAARLSPQEVAVLRRLMEDDAPKTADSLAEVLAPGAAAPEREKRRHHAHEVVRRLRARLPRGSHRIATDASSGYRWLAD